MYSSELENACESHNIQIIEKCIEKYGINYRDYIVGNTILIYAIEICDDLICEYIVNKYKDVIDLNIHKSKDLYKTSFIQNKIGCTALHKSIFMLLSNKVDILLKAGANPNIYNHKNITPLDNALLLRPEKVNILLKYGAKVHKSDIYMYNIDYRYRYKNIVKIIFIVQLLNCLL